MTLNDLDYCPSYAVTNKSSCLKECLSKCNYACILYFTSCFNKFIMTSTADFLRIMS